MELEWPEKRRKRGRISKFLLLMTSLLVGAILTPFLMTQPNIKTPGTPKPPSLGLPNLELPDLSMLTDLTKPAPAKPVPAYKWQDDRGRWHLSGKPPKGIQAEVVDLGPPNIMPNIEIPEPVVPLVQTVEGTPAQRLEIDSMLDVYMSVPELIQDAHDVVDQSHRRIEILEMIGKDAE